MAAPGCWWDWGVSSYSPTACIWQANDRERAREGKGGGGGMTRGAASCVCEVVRFQDRTTATIRKKEALRDEWGWYFIDHISKLLPSSSSHPFLSVCPPSSPSLFSDRLSYTAPSVTGIPSCFHSDEVRGGHSLLAVVCNHHGSCCVFIGPPPPLLTLLTLLFAAERDPGEPKGPDCLDPEVRGVYRVSAGVFVRSLGWAYRKLDK